MKTADVIVIGAGIAGASAAYELAPSFRVLMLEAESTPGFHATGRSAAMLVTGYGAGASQELCNRSRDFFVQPPEGFTETPLLKPLDVLWIARNDQLKSFENKLSASTEFRSIPLDDAQLRCPVISGTYLEGGALGLDNSAMEIDVHALHHGYIREFRRRGGVLSNDTQITSIEYKNGVWKLKSGTEHFECKYVVNAAGAWADQVAGLAGLSPVGLTPMMRTVITFPAPPGESVSGWPFVVDIEEGFYFKPEAGTVLASPADETPSPPCDAQPDEFGIASTVDRIERATTMEVKRIISKWAGLRTFAADRAPVVGWDPENPYFIWLAGQGGSGVMTAPALAQYCSQTLGTESASRDWGWMNKLAPAIAPDRYKAQAVNRNKSA